MNVEASPRTVVDFLRVTQQHLSRRGFENPRLEAEYLLGHVLELDRVGLYLHFDRPLSLEEINQFRSALRQRLNHQPLQWILGKIDFCGIQLMMRTGVFIPRPETELLVEITHRTLKEIIESGKMNPDQTDNPLRILDIGTGSGAIALALASSIPDITVLGCDVSSSALELASENANRLKLSDRAIFSRWDVLDYRIPVLFEEPYYWITMNPPYVRSGEWDSLPLDVKAEPRTALDGGDDGLTFYRRLKELMPDILLGGGGVSVEVGIGQAEVVRGMFADDFQEVKCAADYAGIDRIVYGVGYRHDDL